MSSRLTCINKSTHTCTHARTHTHTYTHTHTISLSISHRQYCLGSIIKFSEILSPLPFLHTVIPSTTVIFTYRAYQDLDSDAAQLIFEVAVPQGNNNTQVIPPPPSRAGSAQRTPPQFAPFPSFAVGRALSEAGLVCFRPDKVHINIGVGIGSLGDCAGLSAGPIILFWPQSTIIVDERRPGEPKNDDQGVVAAVYSAADNFRDSLQSISSPPFACTLYYNVYRDDYVFCASKVCEETQIASGYQAIGREGFSSSDMGKTDSLPLYFFWSSSKQVGKNE